MLGGVLVEKLEPRKFAETIERYFLQVTGVRIRYSELARDELGKILPVSDWHLSVSHSENYLAVAVYDDENVGVDIEKRQHGGKLSSRVLRKILAPGEVIVNGDYLNNYVIKEAYAKYLGEGLSMGFSRYDANKLLADAKVKWKNLSTDEYVCYAVRDII